MKDLTSVLGAAGMTGMFRVKVHIQTKNGYYSFQNTIKKGTLIIKKKVKSITRIKKIKSFRKKKMNC